MVTKDLGVVTAADHHIGQLHWRISGDPKHVLHTVGYLSFIWHLTRRILYKCVRWQRAIPLPAKVTLQSLELSTPEISR